MPLACPRCQRTLPEKAAYCHHDGSPLRAGGPPAGQMLQEFVFPSGKRCKSFDDMAAGCYAEWAEARQLLKEGTFASFLAGIGRADLAKSARDAMSMPDADLALTNFIGALPASVAHGPKLNLSPRRLVVGPVRVGEQKPVVVTLQNEGRGLLQGKLTVAEGAEWLSLVEGPDTRSAAVSTNREQAVKLVVNTAALNTNNAYSGKLVAVTNGGVAELPIRLDLVTRPFARAPYAGANSPQDLARKMRDNPKPAVEMLANGDIARWFASNGWAYPIIGAPVPGLAAVQQYFEELGLARAPQIVVAQTDFRFKGSPSARLSFQIAISSPARKLVYARAECSTPWLRLQAPSVSDQGHAAFEVEIEPALLTEDKTYPGVVKVVANAGQTFIVAVQVEMSGNKRGWFSSKPAPAPAPPPPAPTFTPTPPAPPVPTFTP
ncbi:MAG: hypothetical protein K2W96_28905, partial [Gemmataceae bacterium]|nr:hypothetical protein [Gemmataceae bacterium]